MAGLMAAFIMMKPGVGTEYLTQAAGAGAAIRTAVILLMINGAITLVISLAAFPVIRRYSLHMAIALVAVSAVWIVMQLVDNVYLLSMLGLSRRFAEGGAVNADLYNMVAAQLRSTRVVAHYTELLVIDIWFGLFFGALFAFRLVPRVLSAIGLLAVALHIIGIPMSMFAGYATILDLAYGLAISYLLVGGWLLLKGFRPGSRVPEPEAISRENK